MSEILSTNPNTEPVSPIIMLPLEQARVPAWNPRRFINEPALLRLMAFIQSGGQIPPIWLWKGTGNAPFDIISGQRRHEAYRRLGKTHIAAQIMDITLAEAIRLSLASNQDDKPHWLGEFEVVETYMSMDKTLTQGDLHRLLGWSRKRISHAVSLTSLLNPATRQLIEQSAKQSVTPGNTSRTDEDNSDETWVLTEKVACQLAPLAANSDQMVAQDQAEKMISLITDGQLTSSQTKELVSHALSGKDLGEFEPTVKVRKARTPSAKSPVKEPAPSDDKLPQSSPALRHTASARASTVPHATDTHKTQSAQPGHPPQQTASTKAPTQMSESETILWDAAAGISVITQIKAKIKKGERPSFFEALLLTGHTLWKITEWLLKHTYHIVKSVTKVVWKLFKESMKSTFKALGPTVYRVTRTLLGIAFLAVCAYVAWDSYAHGFHPLHALVTLFTLVMGIIRG
ncbi:MAG TPA: ParB/RepB/Spo0J family partition protein [bacterium]|jgi:hypothetical protein|nr:ParB/RepB/Spo0J family partition protein [bacterium]